MIYDIAELADNDLLGCSPVGAHQAYKLKKGINGQFYLTYDWIYGSIFLSIYFRRRESVLRFG